MAQVDTRNEIQRVWSRWANLAQKGENGLPWTDVRNPKRNSIMDAEALLCLLMPQGELKQFKLASMFDSIAKTLKPLQADHKSKDACGAAFRAIIRKIISDFFETYGDFSFFESKDTSTINPFDSESYLDSEIKSIAKETSPDEEVAVEVKKRVKTSTICTTDAFSFSTQVCLYSLLLIKEILESDLYLEDAEKKAWNDLKKKINVRLTYSLQGLLSSFCVIRSDTTLTTLKWQETVQREWVERKESELPTIKSKIDAATQELIELRRAIKALRKHDDNTELGKRDFFEIGFSWGPLSPDHIILDPDDETNKKAIEFARLQEYSALPEPYFYFTVSAMDAIALVSSDFVINMDLLNQEQLALRAKLANIARLVKNYWKNMALAPDDNDVWEIEKMPWKPSDGAKFASEYWNLYLLRLIQDNIPTNKKSIDKLIGILQELARRSRISVNPYPVESDIAVDKIHHNGYSIYLVDKNNDGIAFYKTVDFAPQLLKACAIVLQKATFPEHLEQLNNLADLIWNHISRRRDYGSANGSWDNLANAYEHYDFGSNPPIPGNHNKLSSWYFTHRTVEALVSLHKIQLKRPEVSDILIELADSLLTEIEWLSRNSDKIENLDQEEKNDLTDQVRNGKENLSRDPLSALVTALELAKKLSK